MSGTGGSSSAAANTNTTPSVSTRSRPLLQTPLTSTVSAATPPTPKASVSGAGSGSQFPLVDDKIYSRYTSTLAAETNKRKIDIADHLKRLAELRKEVEYLDSTDWMYEPVDKILGK